LEAIDTVKALAGRAGEGFAVAGGERADVLLAGRALDAVFCPLWGDYATLGDGADLPVALDRPHEPGAH
jgi:hypothetical protein